METSEQPVTCSPSCDELDARLVRRCVPGNDLFHLRNGGEFVPAMLRAIRLAGHTVDLEMFRAHPGALWALLESELVSCAARGVRVRAVFDAVGSRAMMPQMWRHLRKSGVDLRLFRPISVRSPRLSAQRDHRKILIVDDRVAFTGGMSFDDVFFENTHGPTWRETMVRVQGPVVAEMRRTFAATWAEVTEGSQERRESLAPVVQGPAHARFVASTASAPAAQELFYAAIVSAQESLFLTNPFVMPSRTIVDALKRAARQGVDVRLLVPGGEAFDRFKLVRLAMEGLYAAFLSAGIRIFEYQPTMLHAKTMVVDGRWCSVGSSNLDARSLYYNHEADLASCYAPFASVVADAFVADTAEAREVRSHQWETRSATTRALEFLASAIRMQL